MVDHRTRRGLPERWLLPPPPRDAAVRARWDAATFEQRRRWARLRRTPPESLDRADAEVVAALAQARIATRWRLLVAAPVLGWLVLMTVWGFGRATYPQDADSWFAIGLAMGAAVGIGAFVALGRHLHRCRLHAVS